MNVLSRRERLSGIAGAVVGMIAFFGVYVPSVRAQGRWNLLRVEYCVQWTCFEKLAGVLDQGQFPGNSGTINISATNGLRPDRSSWSEIPWSMAGTVGFTFPQTITNSVGEGRAHIVVDLTFQNPRIPWYSSPTFSARIFDAWQYRPPLPSTRGSDDSSLCYMEFPVVPSGSAWKSSSAATIPLNLDWTGTDRDGQVIATYGIRINEYLAGSGDSGPRYVWIYPVYEWQEPPAPTINAVGLSSPFVLPGGSVLVWASVLDAGGNLDVSGTAKVEAVLRQSGQTLTLSDSASDADARALGANDGVYVGFWKIPDTVTGTAYVDFRLGDKDQGPTAYFEVVPSPKPLLVLTDLEALYAEFLKTAPRAAPADPAPSLLAEDADGNGIPDFFDLLSDLFTYLQSDPEPGMLWCVERESPSYRPFGPIDRRLQSYVLFDLLHQRLGSARTPQSIAILGDDYVVPHYRLPVPGLFRAEHTRGWSYCVNTAIGADNQAGFQLSDVPYAEFPSATPPADASGLPYPHAGIARVYGKTPAELRACLQSLRQPIPVIDAPSRLYSAGLLNIASADGELHSLAQRHIRQAFLAAGLRGFNASTYAIPAWEPGLCYHYSENAVRWTPANVAWSLEKNPLTFALAHGGPTHITCGNNRIVLSHSRSGPIGPDEIILSDLSWVAPGHLWILFSCQTGLSVDADCSMYDALALHVLRRGVAFAGLTTLGASLPTFPTMHLDVEDRFLKSILLPWGGAFAVDRTPPYSATIGAAFRDGLRDMYRYAAHDDFNRHGAYGVALYGWPTQAIRRSAAGAKLVDDASAPSHIPPASTARLDLGELPRMARQLVIPVEMGAFQPTASEDGTTFFRIVNGAGLTGKAFEPVLPLVCKVVLLPTGSDVQAISLLDAHFHEHPGPVAPHLNTPFILGTADDPVERALSGEPPELPDPYPPAILEHRDEVLPDGSVRLNLLVTPLQYHPSDGSASLYDHVEIAVDYTVPRTGVTLAPSPGHEHVVVIAGPGADPPTVELVAWADATADLVLRWVLWDRAGSAIDGGSWPVSLAPGANPIALDLEPLHWTPGPKDLTICLYDARGIVAAASISVSALGISIEASMPPSPIPSGADALAVNVRVFDETGVALPGLSASVDLWLDGAPAPIPVLEPEPGRYQVRLPLSSVPPGGHLLTLGALDDRGLAATETTSFELLAPAASEVAITAFELAGSGQLEVEFEADISAGPARLETGSHPAGPWSTCAGARLHAGGERHTFVIPALARSGPAFYRVVVDSDGESANLLLNPGGEEGGGSRTGSEVLPIPGWNIAGGFTAGLYGGRDLPTAAESERIGGGANFFYGGPNNAFASAWQLVDVGGDAPAIDSGQRLAVLSAFLGVLGDAGDAGDEARVRAEFVDAEGGVLGEMRLGPVHGTGGLLQAATERAAVPPGTRQIRVVLESIRRQGSSNDGCFDNVSLTMRVASQGWR